MWPETSTFSVNGSVGAGFFLATTKKLCTWYGVLSTWCSVLGCGGTLVPAAAPHPGPLPGVPRRGRRQNAYAFQQNLEPRDLQQRSRLAGFAFLVGADDRHVGAAVFGEGDGGGLVELGDFR